MANEITVQQLNRFTGISHSATPIDTADFTELSSDTACYIDIDTVAYDPSKILLIVGVDSNATAAAVKFVSSTQGIYSGSGIADVTVGINDSAIAYFSTGALTSGALGCLTVMTIPETARIKDTDGYINIEKSTADADTAAYFVGAIVLP